MRAAPIQMRPSAIATTKGRRAVSNVTRYAGICGVMSDSVCRKPLCESGYARVGELHQARFRQGPRERLSAPMLIGCEVGLHIQASRATEASYELAEACLVEVGSSPHQRRALQETRKPCRRRLKR